MASIAYLCVLATYFLVCRGMLKISIDTSIDRICFIVHVCVCVCVCVCACETRESYNSLNLVIPVKLSIKVTHGPKKSVAGEVGLL